MRLAATHADWVLGFADEVWWSRVARPRLASWGEKDAPLRLLEQSVTRGDPDPKALACYGLLIRDENVAGQRDEQMLLRFVDGRPVSEMTTQFLDWCGNQLAAQGKTALLLVWDNASWHVSKKVRQWISAHNRQVKERGTGVRMVVSPLPVKSPWLNPIEPKWMHGKQWIVEPARLLTADEVAERVCACFGCVHEPHLAIHEQVS